MKISKSTYGFIFVILVFTKCVSEFDPPSVGYKNLLVVEAFLSNDALPFEVKLSRTTTIDTTAIIPEFNANVQLISEQGESFNLYESGQGLYTSIGIINPTPTVGYKLSIRTANGNQYESGMVIMRKTPEIDSVTFRYEDRPHAGVQGIQIMVNTHDPANSTWYYRWEWEETWIFHTAYQSNHIYDNGFILPREDDIYTCWKHSSSKTVEISSSKRLTEDIINEYPLLYVTTESDRLRDKYSINVKQFALSEASYNYWQELEKVTESLGTLFDPQPSTVYSNINNINDDAEIVLGYFDAASVEEQRIFITRSELPQVGIPNRYRYCEDTIVWLKMIPFMIQSGYMLAYETQDEWGNFVYLMSDPWCIDCTLAGTNVEPDFWEW